MSLYPSLEDMKATDMIKAQVAAFRPQQPTSYPTLSPSAPYGNSGYTMSTTAPANSPPPSNAVLAYPRLHEFMGLELTEQMIRDNMPEYLESAVAVPQASGVAVLNKNNVMAPVSGGTLSKSFIAHGIRHCQIKKQNGKLGVRVRAMNTGVFVCLVIDGSAASKAGLRFGDQLLQADGVDMVGMSVDKVHAIFKKAAGGVELAVRDRPFERTVTLVRDSKAHVGFQFKNGKIINIVKDSSAARNGLLTDHTLLEMNGHNVIGLKDKEITALIAGLTGTAINVTIMPTFLYSHMVKEMDASLFGKMDRDAEDF